MNTLTYRIHLEPEEEGGFTVTVPALPGCVTWGKDYEQSLEMARDAINCYLVSLLQDGLPLPTDTSPNWPIDALIQITPDIAA